jgi:hypothetical protein
MKRLLLFLALSVTLIAVDVPLSWNSNPADQEVLAYRVYQATNVVGPFVCIGSTNSTSFVIKGLTPGQYFWYVTASNYWGEGLQSDTVHTPTVATKVMSLGIK